jgi:type I restriction-modification system DNA methylase subunit
MLLEEFEKLRERAYAALKDGRSDLGQFYTPPEVATLLASMLPNQMAGAVSIVDPGAGHSLFIPAPAKIKTRCST